VHCRDHFHARYRSQDSEGAQGWLSKLQKISEQLQCQLQQRSTELQQLLLYLVNLRCDDIGLEVTQELLLPLLAERLDAAAYAAKEAAANAAAAELLGENRNSSSSSSSSCMKAQVRRVQCAHVQL
jgi:hypothetical protein